MDIKESFALIIAILFITDLAIFLNIPLLGQILGFLFLTILPGLLILQILKLNEIGSTEKFVLSVGLSISFLMFFGLLINTLSLSIGYETPLSTIPLLISFNIAFITLAIIGYKVNKEPLLSLPNLNLSTSEKTFLIVPILFPALSIFGMNLMNTTNNNIVLMFMLFLIPTYVVFVCFSNHKFPKRLYPVVIFLISISLVLMFALRSNHIIGVDRHSEYYFFLNTLSNFHWSVFGHSLLDACLSISLLPTIYQSILNISNEEHLFMTLSPLMISILPLIVYLLSKKYIGELCAFLAAFFFMSQYIFAFPGGRSQMGVLFFALAMLVFFSDGIDLLSKKLLFIVFMVSCLVSHYSTTYIFFFMMLGSLLALKMLSIRYNFRRVITGSLVILFFITIFFWYSQVTEVAFNYGVFFIKNTLISLQDFFIEESRSVPMQKLLGGVGIEAISFRIELVLTWITFLFIAIGVLSMLKRYKEMVILPGIKTLKPEFLKRSFEVEYFVIALICSGLLVATVAVPHLSKGYNLNRIYNMVVVILSVFFVLGSIILSKYLKIRASVVILVILIPYFLCVLGPMHNICGYPRALTLNSEGRLYNMYYVHDQESCGAKWLKNNAEKKIYIYTYPSPWHILISSGNIPKGLLRILYMEDERINGYIYLRYYNVVNGKVLVMSRKSPSIEEHSMEKCKGIFIDKKRIYDNGGSEIYR